MSQPKMHKKAHLANNFGIGSRVLVFCFLLQGCSFGGRNVPKVHQSPLKPNQEETVREVSSPRDVITEGEIEYKYINKQLFIKIHFLSTSTSNISTIEKNHGVWALLDSSATQNLMVELDSVKNYQMFVGMKSNKNFTHQNMDSITLSQDFYPLGSSSPSEYQVILGQPFFRANCILLSLGVPIKIQPNNRKKCPLTGSSDWKWFRLGSHGGQYFLNVKIGKTSMELALDTGSGISAVQRSLLKKTMSATGTTKKVLYTFGEVKRKKLYNLAEDIRFGKNISFRPSIVLDSDEVWEANYDYYPTLGMDFFQTFRIYIDFGSKIIGIESNEKQGQNHSSNEWGS